MQTLRKLCLGVAGAGLLLLVIGLTRGDTAIWQPAAVAASIGLADRVGCRTGLRIYQFTAWIVAAVVTAMIYPGFLQNLSPDNPDRPNNKWIMLIIVQLVMFGMGTQMSLRDFAELGHNSWAVAVGVLLQFSVMPLVGYGLAVAFGFPPEVAAGIVLIGSCSSGLASNVMTYLANANLALSIALTAAGTILAPLTTPFWMYLLAGQWVPIDFVGMMLNVIKIVIAPIGAAMLHDYLRWATPRGRQLVHAARSSGRPMAGRTGARRLELCRGPARRQRSGGVQHRWVSLGCRRRRNSVSLAVSADARARKTHAALLDVWHHLLHRDHHRHGPRRTASHRQAACVRFGASQSRRTCFWLLACPRIWTR